MRFDASDQADSSQVEDRRGMRFPGGIGGGAGGLGLLGLLIYGLVRLLGGDTDATPGDDEPTRGMAEPQARNQALPTLGGSCAGVTSTTDPAKFIACVETNVQSFWSHELKGYRPAKLVLFTDETPSPCGGASASTGPFYCPVDQKIYLDTAFFDELRRRFHAKGGDFAEAYVVAHELGHHVQHLRGTDARVREAERARPSQKNALSVRLELQADCYAGVWGHAAYEKGKVLPEEIALALDAAAAVGDDRIQRAARGRVVPETFTHGSAAERQKWFTIGMQTGDSEQCDTFGGSL